MRRLVMFFIMAFVFVVAGSGFGGTSGPSYAQSIQPAIQPVIQQVIQLAASHAKEEMSSADKAQVLVKENPGKSAALIACGVAVAFFPPALLICGASAAGGVTVDEVGIPAMEN